MPATIIISNVKSLEFFKTLVKMSSIIFVEFIFVWRNVIKLLANKQIKIYDINKKYNLKHKITVLKR